MKFYRRIGKNKYVKCAKCGIVRNIEESPRCPVCEDLKIKTRHKERKPQS